MQKFYLQHARPTRGVFQAHRRARFLLGVVAALGCILSGCLEFNAVPKSGSVWRFPSNDSKYNSTMDLTVVSFDANGAEVTRQNANVYATVVHLFMLQG